jgi:hypothetical protein
MTLTEVRTLFRTISGRYDLVNNDGSDNGANWYINQGIKVLDGLQETPASSARYQKDIAIGAYRFTLGPQYCRSIEEVWMMDSESRWELEKVTLNWMRTEYSEEFSSIDTGSPLYYCPLIHGLGPDQKTLDITGSDIYTTQFTYDHEDLIFADQGSWYSYRGILWMPPSDSIATVEIVGKFFSAELSGDTDTNYWTVKQPMAVVQAACYVLESMNRNFEGARDWLGALGVPLTGIDHDFVGEEIAGVSEMEG